MIAYFLEWKCKYYFKLEILIYLKILMYALPWCRFHMLKYWVKVGECWRQYRINIYRIKYNRIIGKIMQDIKQDKWGCNRRFMLEGFQREDMNGWYAFNISQSCIVIMEVPGEPEWMYFEGSILNEQLAHLSHMPSTDGRFNTWSKSIHLDLNQIHLKHTHTISIHGSYIE